MENGLSQRRQGGKQEDQLGYYCIAEPRANGDQNLRNGSRDGQTDKYKAHFRSKVALLIGELDQEVSQGEVASGIAFILSYSYYIDGDVHLAFPEVEKHSVGKINVWT